jgi:carbamoyl-phosphate synthase large subunit
MREVIIGVSGINATDNPGPGIPVAKSLKESALDCKLFGLSYDVNDPGHYLSHYLDKSFILPYPTNGWEGIFKRLLRIKKDFGLDIVIPCLDAELPLYIRYAEDLKKAGIKTFLPSEEQFELRNKDQLAEVAEAIGAHYPKTWKIYSADELPKIFEDYPEIMIKGQYYKAYLANTLSDAVKHFTSIAREWGYPVLVQELVNGEEINLTGVGNGKGGSLGMVAIKKHTTTSLGKIWSGVTIYHKALLEITEKFIKTTKWRGPFEMECIVDKDKIHLIEINPRFPAWVYFAAGVGINLPERLVKTMLEQPVSEKCLSATLTKLFVI